MAHRHAACDIVSGPNTKVNCRAACGWTLRALRHTSVLRARSPSSEQAFRAAIPSCATHKSVPRDRLEPGRWILRDIIPPPPPRAGPRRPRACLDRRRSAAARSRLPSSCINVFPFLIRPPLPPARPRGESGRHAHTGSRHTHSDTPPAAPARAATRVPRRGRRGGPAGDGASARDARRMRFRLVFPATETRTPAPARRRRRPSAVRPRIPGESTDVRVCDDCAMTPVLDNTVFNTRAVGKR